MAHQSFIFRSEWKDAIQEFSRDVRLEIYEAVIRYATLGEIVELRPLAKMAFNFIKIDIDRSHKNLDTPTSAQNEVASNAIVPCAEACEDQTQDASTTKSLAIRESEEDGDFFVVPGEETEDNPKTNYQGLKDYYNSYCKNTNLVKCSRLTDKRKAAIRARIHEFGKKQVALAIQKAAASSFLNGRNDRDWRADFDFVFNANKMARILEGKYDDRERTTTFETGRNIAGTAAERQLQAGAKAYGDLMAGIADRLTRRANEPTTDLLGSKAG